MSQVQRIVRDYTGLNPAMDWARDMTFAGLAGGEVLITLSRPTRSNQQNDKLWAMLRDVARQRPMVINGESVYATAEDWKDVFTAAYRGEMRMAQGLDGGVVLLGMRTSKMRKAELSELIELIYAYGSDWEIRWSEQAMREEEAA